MESTISLKKDITKVVKNLDEDYRNILIGRLSGKTLTTTAEETGIDIAKVRRIENKAWQIIADTIGEVGKTSKVPTPSNARPAPKKELEGDLRSDEGLDKYKNILSKRTYNTLVKNDISTTLTLEQAMQSNKLDFKGLGRKAYAEIAKLARRAKLNTE